MLCRVTDRRVALKSAGLLRQTVIIAGAGLTKVTVPYSRCLLIKRLDEVVLDGFEFECGLVEFFTRHAVMHDSSTGEGRDFFPI